VQAGRILNRTTTAMSPVSNAALMRSATSRRLRLDLMERLATLSEMGVKQKGRANCPAHCADKSV
jgi:hypothetical protein